MPKTANTRLTCCNIYFSFTIQTKWIPVSSLLAKISMWCRVTKDSLQVPKYHYSSSLHVVKESLPTSVPFKIPFIHSAKIKIFCTGITWRWWPLHYRPRTTLEIKMDSLLVCMDRWLFCWLHRWITIPLRKKREKPNPSAPSSNRT